MFFFKQKTAYEMRISDWSSDVCSSDLVHIGDGQRQKCRCLDEEGGLGAQGCQGDHGAHTWERSCGTDRSAGSGDRDRKSVVSGESVSVRVDLGGRRIIKNTHLLTEAALTQANKQAVKGKRKDKM